MTADILSCVDKPVVLSFWAFLRAKITDMHMLCAWVVPEGVRINLKSRTEICSRHCDMGVTKEHNDNIAPPYSIQTWREDSNNPAIEIMCSVSQG